MHPETGQSVVLDNMTREVIHVGDSRFKIEVNMSIIIYVRLLNEGIEVFRPVSATQIAPNVFVLDSKDSCDPEDEEWEFPPGSQVSAIARMIEGNRVLIANALNLPNQVN